MCDLGIEENVSHIGMQCPLYQDNRTDFSNEIIAFPLCNTKRRLESSKVRISILIRTGVSLPFSQEKYLIRNKEGRNWVLRRFQQLRSYRDEIETRNREEIPCSSRIVPRGHSVAEGP